MECPRHRVRGIHAARGPQNDELTTLRAKLAGKTRECLELHHRLDAAATVIAALHPENVLLRQELTQRGQLVALQGHRSHPGMNRRRVKHEAGAVGVGSRVASCLLGELHPGGQAEFGVDVGEVRLHGAR